MVAVRLVLVMRGARRRHEEHVGGVDESVGGVDVWRRQGEVIAPDVVTVLIWMVVPATVSTSPDTQLAPPRMRRGQCSEVAQLNPAGSSRGFR